MWNRTFQSWLLSDSAFLCRSSFHYLSIVSILFFTNILSAQTIPCDGSYYLFLTPSGNVTTSAMYRVTTHATTNLPVYELINPDLKHRVTAAGYSVHDQQIYALDYHTFQLLRIDMDGIVEVFPVPLYLDTTLTFQAGEVSPSGGNLIVVGRNKKTEKDKTLFSIRLYREDHIAGQLPILHESGTALEDLTFDPIRGTFYGYDALNNKLAWVDNFSGQVNDYFSRNMPGVGNLGSLFFDRSGQLHAYGSSGGSEENTFFNIDKLQGKPQNIASGPRSRFSDGCACPYTIRSFKTVQPQQALPCSQLTITYDIINHAGTAYSYISVNDTFPPGFVITKILKTPRTSIVASGVGSNILSVEGIDLILDTNRIVLTLEITEAAQPGIYASQSILQDLPTALGGKIRSDNPNTASVMDATAIELIGEQSKGQLTQQSLRCDGNGIFLETTITDATYLWSTGDTTSSTVAYAVGWYALTITSDCGRFVDSIYIETIPEPLQVALPPTKNIELGEEINITPTTNTNRFLTYQWQASDGSTIACASCATLSTFPLRNTTYTLLITDENGCQASDSIQVEVLPVREVFAPTAFSPNDDGINDIFYLQGKSNAKILYLRIFDRWGNQVFQVQNGVLNDQTYGWNGRVRTKQAWSQTFIYLAEIEFPDGAKKRLSGEVLVVK